MGFGKFALTGLVGWSLLSAAGLGCSSQGDDSDRSEGEMRSDSSIKTLIPKTPWAVDMRCVDGQASCPRSSDALQGKNIADYKYGRSSDYFFGIQDQNPQVKVWWDQVFRRDGDGKPVSTSGGPVVIDKGGNAVAPPVGYVNIIPMLMDTDPLQQKHITSSLQDGDVLVYFHPEDIDGKSVMERRVSHVAMYYDSKDLGQRRVHHIDNPHSYGPEFNHRASRHMPFHAFRYKPGTGYGKAARNWAVITNANSPFAGFFELNLQRDDQLAQFAKNAIAGQPIPKVYCSGLAFTNLNLAVNYPLNQSGLGKAGLWNDFQSKSFTFKDTNEALASSKLASNGLEATAKDKLIFAPYTPSEMLTAYIDVAFGHLPVEVRRQHVTMNPENHPKFAEAFNQVSFSDEALGAKSPELVASARQKPITADMVAIWGRAYGLDKSKTEEFLNDAKNAALKQKASAMGIDTRDRSPLQIIREIERGTKADGSDRLFENRFVPPRIWLDMADGVNMDATDKSDLVYVGSVVNCELLSNPDDPRANPCAASTGGPAAQFSEGGADTSTYLHYQVKNGGERTHRRFDATPGPEKLGKGTKITVRATASSGKDTLFLFHVPAMYKGHPTTGMSVIDYDQHCTEQYKEGGAGTCAPQLGIALKVPADRAGAFTDGEFTYNLTDVCQIVDANTMKCPVAKRLGPGNYEITEGVSVSRDAHGLLTTTMADLGKDTQGYTDPNERCVACGTGGAHFNGWNVVVRNDP